jgi:hypothetical protein
MLVVNGQDQAIKACALRQLHGRSPRRDCVNKRHGNQGCTGRQGQAAQGC